VNAAGICRFLVRNNDSGTLQLFQAIRQNITCDALARLGELLETPVTTHHQVPDDEQRPSVAEHFQRHTDRAAGSRFVPFVVRHTGHVISITCKMQVIWYRESLLGYNLNE